MNDEVIDSMKELAIEAIHGLQKRIKNRLQRTVSGIKSGLREKLLPLLNFYRIA